MITGQNVLDALTVLVERKGRDFVYTDEMGGTAGDCKYVHFRGQDEQQPGCAVGAVNFILLGEYVPEFCEMSTPDNYVEPKYGKVLEAHETLKALDDWWGARYTEGARTLLSQFQASQDDGNEYGWCLDELIAFINDDENTEVERAALLS